ncbi:glycoside hydrolase family 19 protein [Pseudomonas citronellolis]|uniref:glycoside hydrolase family 19 protein n=1 Tax=Pseudomonas citronellolis TaxID=53408 RepID=UPI00209F97FF|nr:glycoside hydrolase family 19 protein [Pseudomonas citronellolis]MCP1605506.1 hypothetical protein [Pseudomonas citronellolis]MCP1656785.1 hypothetical protein [Pseudomonas citronellolis]MCP1725577.1 hypothetical protein [Pseudomonas citronellolis]
MEKQKKVERWSYPFKAKGSNGGASSEITDPQVYYDALAKAGSGFYPVSSNGLWHGGVHFDQNTGAQLDQSSVRCIADGEVVAYRIDEKYKTLTYGEGASAHETIYSTGFVLVRHRLELPPVPAPATPATGGPQPAATPPAAEPDLTFYSLYMHLMDWQGYQDKPELERPAFWAGDTRIVKQGAPDKLQGLRVRATPNGTVLGVLPRGTLVEAEAAGPGINPNWLKFIRATPAVAGLAENTGYLHKGPADGSVLKALGEGRHIVNHKAKDPIEPAQKGANIRSAANGNSPILGLLPAGTQVRVSPTATTKSYHKLLAIIQDSATPAVSAEQLASEGYVWVKDLEAIKEPQARDSVFLVEPPVPIQAGALIGHLGKYQAATQGAPQDLLHLEVFTCDDMEAFVTQSRARAKQLKPEQKTLLKIPSETKLITREDATQENPPQVSDPGQPTAYDMILPLAVLEALPAERKITLTTTTGGTTTTERWWKLENMPGKDGQPIRGWVKEDELITPRLHPWDWEGFDFIKETSTLSDQYACKLSSDGVLDDGEKTNYQAQINQGDSGPIKERLYDIIDTNNDEKLTPEEIRNALGKPWHAQSISRLIIQYESEWYADPGLSKWEALNCYIMKTGKKNWEQEKNRIRTLIFWKTPGLEVGIAPSMLANHIHPIELITCFSRNPELINIDKFLELYISIHSTFNEAQPNFESNSRENLREFLKNINKYYTENNDKPNIYELSYMLATARHEMYHFPTGEYFSKKPEVGGVSYFNKYDPVLADTQERRQNAIDHENTQEGDGYKYRGRGPVHLTWKINYRRSMEKFGPDFVNNPDLAAEFENSVPIMIWGMKSGIFTGKNINNYINSTTVDYEGARKVINGVDQKALIASYARKFEEIFKKSSSAPADF